MVTITEIHSLAHGIPAARTRIVLRGMVSRERQRQF
jgi:hypothetical protein